MKNCNCETLRDFRKFQENFISQTADCEGYLDDFLKDPKDVFLLNPLVQRIEKFRENRRLQGENYDLLVDKGQIVFANELREVRSRFAAGVMNLITFNSGRRYSDVCSGCYGVVGMYDSSHLDGKIRRAQEIIFNLGLGTKIAGIYSGNRF